MSRRQKIFLLIALVAGALVIAFLVLFNSPARREPAGEKSVPSAAATVSRQSVSKSANLKVPSQEAEVKLTSEQEGKFEQQKKRLPWMPENQLRALIARGLNVDNIEKGVTKIQADLTQLAVAMNQYRGKFSTFPSGTNAEIATALMGGNPGKVIFIEWPEKSRGADGEFLDPWGTPYEFKIEGNKIVIRSAGPDLDFETKDDVLSSSY